MLIEIDDYKTVAEIQEKFSLCFPYLKIEFYDKPHHWQESSTAEHSIDTATCIENIRKKHDPGILEIKSWYKTGKVNNFLRDYLD